LARLSELNDRLLSTSLPYPDAQIDGTLNTIDRGILAPMQTTIDRAGRLVVPKELRDRLGIGAGTQVDIHEDGSGLRIDVIATDAVVEIDDYLLIGGDATLTDNDVHDLRLADQR
jgi:AbrB family looped-hinge helix DNA binding protein